MRNGSGEVKMSGSERIKANINIRQFLLMCTY